jgi:AraC-like DNA-binding protein
MFRLLVVNNSGNRDLEDTVKLYVDALSLPIEVQAVADHSAVIRHLDADADYDLFIAPTPDNNDILKELSQSRAFQQGLKTLFLSDNPERAPHISRAHCTLPLPIPISVFYNAINEMLPEAIANAPHQKDSRWLIGHDALLLQVLSVLKIMREKFRQDISLTDLAAQAYVSPCYLSTTFSKFFGVSPIVYINQLRMEEAVTLLTTTVTSVTDICNQVGYSSLPYFCTCFKKKYGMTPSEFRQQNTSL